jgi:hypothetical protein
MEEGISLNIFLPIGGLNAMYVGFSGCYIGFK